MLKKTALAISALIAAAAFAVGCGGPDDVDKAPAEHGHSDSYYGGGY